MAPILVLEFSCATVVDEHYAILLGDHNVVKLDVEVQIPSGMDALHALNQLATDLNKVLVGKHTVIPDIFEGVLQIPVNYEC